MYGALTETVLRKGLPFAFAGAVALSANTAANASEWYMINPEDLNVSVITFNAGCDLEEPLIFVIECIAERLNLNVQAATGADSTQDWPPDSLIGLYALYEDAEIPWEGGGALALACGHASIKLPDGAELKKIRLSLNTDEYAYYDVKIWQVNGKRNDNALLLSEDFGTAPITPDAPADNFKIENVHKNLSGTINNKRYSYTMQICGLGIFYQARIKYDLAS